MRTESNKVSQTVASETKALAEIVEGMPTKTDLDEMVKDLTESSSVSVDAHTRPLLDV